MGVFHCSSVIAHPTVNNEHEHSIFEGFGEIDAKCRRCLNLNIIRRIPHSLELSCPF